MAKIVVKNLKKQFKSNQVLKGLDFICENEIVFVAGKNGAGKTTFIRIALELEKANGGTIDFFTENDDSISKGAVFDTPCLYPNMTCKENLNIFCTGYLNDKEYVESVLQCLNINHDFLIKKAGKCSFGQQHRLSVAIELIRKPKFLFLDEPTIGLDPLSWDLVKKAILLNKKRSNGCVIITGQDYFEISLLADKLLILDGGVAKYYGTVDEFLEKFPKKIVLISNDKKLPSSLKDKLSNTELINNKIKYTFDCNKNEEEILSLIKSSSISIDSLMVEKYDIKKAIVKSMEGGNEI